MARAAIFLTLIVATLIGPWLCCCAYARLVDDSRSYPITAAQPVAPAACPHCQTDASPGVQTSHSPAPSQPKRDCPCCDVPQHESAVAELSYPAPNLPLPLVGTLPLDSEFLAIHLERGEWSEYPPGIGRQSFLIDFCHRLRC